MSTQSIINRNISYLKEEEDKNILESANDFILKRYYDLGKGVSYDKLSYHLKRVSILNQDNCELINIINKSLEEGEIEYEPCKQELINAMLYNESKLSSSKCNITDVCDWDF